MTANHQGSFYTILKRELSAYFNSSIAAIFLIVFSGLNAGLFANHFFLSGQADMRPFFDFLPFVLCVFIPAVSMRFWAEERKTNTLELLLTLPVSSHHLVAGKYLAGLIFYGLALMTTFMIPIMIFTLGYPDMGIILSSYLAAFLLGAFFLALGTFVSGFCRDQMTALVISMSICFALYLLGMEFFAAILDGWSEGTGTFLRHFLGTQPHYISFLRGVMDLKDLLYFVFGILILLILNGLWIEGRMRRSMRLLFVSMSLLLSIVFISANWYLSDIYWGRIDMTRGKVHTIAESSKTILKQLKTPVTVRLYISPQDKLPTGFKGMQRVITDKLEELRLASEGRLRYKVIHPDASNALEAEDARTTFEGGLAEKGIYPFQVQSVESDEIDVRLIYAALGVTYLDRPEDILPQIFTQDLPNLEHLIVSRVHRISLDKMPKIALVAPYEEKEIDAETAEFLEEITSGAVTRNKRKDNYSILQKGLEYEGYKIERIRFNENEPLSDDFTTLVMIEPQDLNEKQLRRMDAFLQSGGSIFIAAQQYDLNYTPTLNDVKIDVKSEKQSILPLLNAWGFELSPHLLGNEEHEIIQISGGGPFGVSLPVKLPIHALIPSYNMNKRSQISAKLDTIFYLWGNPIHQNRDKIREQKLNVRTLFSSSENSWEIDLGEGLQGSNLKPENGISQGPYDLAVWAEGNFHSAFEDNPVENPAEGKLVVMGSAMPFRQNIIKGGGHLQFLFNVMDALTFGEDLADIRAKSFSDTSMPKVSPREKLVWKAVIIFFVPFLIIVMSLYRIFIRNHEKKKYLKSLN